jgi:starch synthase
MNILMVASEAAPYLRTGDVANVVTGLSLELFRQGHDTRLIIPHYRSLVLDSEPRPITEAFDVPLGTYSRKANAWRIDSAFDSTSPPLYLIDNAFYFGRENPYGYLDDYERFVFFARAVLELLYHPDFTSELWWPDVIHGHDWIAGLMPCWLRRVYQGQDDRAPISFVYTLHNANFPGQFGYRALSVAELEKWGIYESIGESASRISFMGRGILAADAVNTVSPEHAKEILQEKHLSDLSQALRARCTGIVGILNGLDYVIYNPAFDDKIKCSFDRDNLPRRRENKQAYWRPYYLMICYRTTRYSL